MVFNTPFFKILSLFYNLDATGFYFKLTPLLLLPLLPF
jgi:hypothetical protein